MKPGRQPLDASDPSVKLTITLTSKRLDDLCVQAKRQRLTLAEYMRQLVDAGVLKNTLK